MQWCWYNAQVYVLRHNDEKVCGSEYVAEVEDNDKVLDEDRRDVL